MPPVLPRKRLRSESPPSEPSAKRPNRSAPTRRGKESVFDVLDTPPTLKKSSSKTKVLLEQEDSSELSEADSSEDEFEDVVMNGAHNGSSHKGKGKGKEKVQESESSDDEEWEDALGHHHQHVPRHHRRLEDEPAPTVSGDIELTLTAGPAVPFKKDGKTGPSKIQRQIRHLTHCMHVQFLMFHNLVRNSWIQDLQVQKILVENLTTGCWRELDQYWRNAGIPDGPARIVKGGWSKKVVKELNNDKKWKATGKNGVQEFNPSEQRPKRKGKMTKAEAEEIIARSKGRNQRDWGASSDRLEPDTAPNLSAGDPLLRLLKYLAAYWKSKFKITAPCLRKRGYLSPASLQAEVEAWKQDHSDGDIVGERIEDIEAFRDLARKCEGSRDVGQQLFTALLRGLGVEARMIASLQPAGFGWSQAEKGNEKDLEKLSSKVNAKKGAASTKATPIKPGRKAKTVNGTKNLPVNLSDSDSDSGSDLSSIISISSSSEVEVKRPKKSSNKYGEELPHPTYWTEALSHLTHTPICVSPLPRSIIAPSSNAELLANFYSRGAAADKAKQVFAYLIAFSSDGTAKDVTTRYLPKHQWPGRTKGFRMPIEKVPIYNKRGKVKKWETFDWFKSVLRPYARSHLIRQPWDEIEDEGDLVPAKPAKPKDMDEEGGRETLQGYKNSGEYVLERHLRREEALKPGAKVVRHFTTGKGENEKQEPVYFRKDIVNCKTVESWHKEGRMIREGEQPLKYVPMRAVTVTRKREIEEREREEGEKVKQGLYSKAQTDWIIPPPIEDGKIPRNAFGNIDVYVPTMIPKGSVHIPLKGTARVCKKLGIDFAEACTGFEFGKQRAVPVLTGVVVAVENEDMVIDAWEADAEQKRQKEEEKRKALVLGYWKRFYGGLRILERMKAEYGEDVALPASEMKSKVKERKAKEKEKKSEWDTFKDHGDDFEGGFIRDDAPGTTNNHAASANRASPRPDADMAGDFITASQEEHMAGGFLPPSQEEHDISRTELTFDHGEAEQSRQATSAVETDFRTPVSLHSTTKQPADEANEVSSDGSDDEPLVPSARSQKKCNARGKATSSRGRGRGRGAKAASSTRRKKMEESDNDEDVGSLSSSPSVPSLPPSDLPSENGSSASPSPPPKKRKVSASVSSPVTNRDVPKRKAARKSDQMVKSHYFATSDEETDLSPQKPSRGRGGGRGRGRGRGRAKKTN